MRSITLSVLFLFSMAGAYAQTQIISTFDTLKLSKADTFYVNYSSSGNDVGFNDGAAHFPCVYDTAYGGYWDHGFSYSNMTDSVTSGYLNQYSAKTAIGYDSSAKYAVAYGKHNSLKLKGAYLTNGFYITNATYAFNSMRDGDAFAKKFGGATGTDKDWFKITVYGYNGGVRHADSVDFYLADFRTGVPQLGYIVKTWDWVDLTPLGISDSLSFVLNSSDTGAYGMNTPAYFCMDNFTVSFPEGVNEVAAPIAKVYPNPAMDALHVSLTDNTVRQLVVMNMSGKIVNTLTVNSAEMVVNTSALSPGVYVLQLQGDGKAGNIRFVKQ